MIKPEAHLFAEAGQIPNNPRLPLLIYKKAVPASAEAIEKILLKHGWQAAWRYGIYTFAHFHSTAHEVLGIYGGCALLRLGHSAGITIEVGAGDVIVIPAGVGHQNLGSSIDFHVVGGYPKGQKADLLKEGEGNRFVVDESIARVPLPLEDPLYGVDGPLMDCWQ